MNFDRIKKIERLKRKNRRNNLIKQLSFLSLPKDLFMEVEANESFCRQVFLTLSKHHNPIILQGRDNEETIYMSIQALRNLDMPTALFNKECRVFFFGEYEIEAVKLNVNEVFMNLENVLDLTRFSKGYGDFILVDENLLFGICIERTEYHYELIKWGF
ncbi:YxiF family protein [Paenibacillus lentus]|uniref:Uncharacterized protein n=1 Tax=Paenibacillus lentus TaxID=1338368 RepID=A0A3S8RPJ8_9BACL|nr:hypothetical protein [Paenibacillus lentus]AZK44858.1 hypothetical protein EIM92_00490 [Paenibacillus lentus]